MKARYVETVIPAIVIRGTAQVNQSCRIGFSPLPSKINMGAAIWMVKMMATIDASTKVIPWVCSRSRIEGIPSSAKMSKATLYQLFIAGMGWLLNVKLTETTKLTIKV